MNDSTKAFQIVMNDVEVREDAWNHETIDREDAHHVNTLKLKLRRITSTEMTSRGYIEVLKSISDGFCSISESSQYWCLFIDIWNIKIRNNIFWYCNIFATTNWFYKS